MAVQLLVVFGSLPAPPAAGEAGGGRAVIFIHDVYELQNMSRDMNASYALANDIDASATRDWNNGSGFEPIEDPTVSNHWAYDDWWYIGVFNGELDGRGFKISNLYMSRPKGGGLFSVINSSAKVSNLALELVDIQGQDMMGALAGVNFLGTVTDCQVSGKVVGTTQNAQKIGMLVGLNRGTISRCSSNGSVEGWYEIGGLVGSTDTAGNRWPNVLVSDCFSWANVKADVDEGMAGGLAGMNSGTIRNCWSMGAVTANNAGGLVGFSNGTVTGSYWNTETSGTAKSSGGTGKTNAQMTKQATFAGWDFDNVWSMDEGQFPRLRKPAPVVNHSPTITTSPATEASPGSLYSLQCIASDPDGDALSWSMTSNASWLAMTPAGLLSGTPLGSDAGSYVVAITASDGKGGTASITFELTVSTGQHKPYWSAVPSNASLVEGSDFRFTAAATDIDAGDAIVYGLTSLPASGLALNATTGEMRWLNVSLGDYSYVLTATDSHFVISHLFSLKVNMMDFSPTIIAVSGPENITVRPASVQTFSVEAASPSGAVLTYEWKENGVTLSTERSFARKFPPGNHTLILLIGDGRYTTTRTFNFTVAPAPKTIDIKPASLPGFEAGIAAAAVVVVVTAGLFWRRERR